MDDDKKINDFCNSWIDRNKSEVQQHQQQHQQLQYSRSLSSKSPVTKEHILQIIVQGMKSNKSNDDLSKNVDTSKMVETSQMVDTPKTVEPSLMTRSEVNTPTTVDGRRHHDDGVDSDTEGSESSSHKKFGLVRYRSLRDHNGRYYLVVKIR